jgi:hypothetical protein
MTPKMEQLRQSGGKNETERKDKKKMGVQTEREVCRNAERRAYQIFLPNCCVR